MSNKTPSRISSVLTVVFLIVVAVVLLFGQLVALNGFSEREGTISLVISLVCQGVSIIGAAVLASRLTRTFIEKFNWNKTLAVIMGVIAGTIPGGLLMSLGLIISLILAEELR